MARPSRSSSGCRKKYRTIDIWPTIHPARSAPAPIVISDARGHRCHVDQLATSIGTATMASRRIPGITQESNQVRSSQESGMPRPLLMRPIPP